MQMNKLQRQARKPRILRTLVLLVAVFLTPLLIAVEDEPPTQPQPAPAVEQQQQSASDTETDSTKPQPAAAPAPPATDTAAKPIKPYKPSETIGADSAVSFPIDI